MTAAATPTEASRGLNAATRVYVGFVVLLACVLLGIGWLHQGPPTEWLAMVVLVALSAASWVLKDNDVGHRVQISLLGVIPRAAASIGGRVGAGLVGALPPAIEF